MRDLRYVRGEDVQLSPDGVRFRVNQTTFVSSLSGRHAVLNLLAGVAVARVNGISEEKLSERVRALQGINVLQTFFRIRQESGKTQR